MIHISQCLECSRLRGNKPGKKGFFCDAFPKGVPLKVMFNGHDHRRPYPGDAGIRFEPAKDGRSPYILEK